MARDCGDRIDWRSSADHRSAAAPNIECILSANWLQNNSGVFSSAILYCQDFAVSVCTDGRKASTAILHKSKGLPTPAGLLNLLFSVTVCDPRYPSLC